MAEDFCIWTQDLASRRTGYAWWKLGMARPRWGHIDFPQVGDQIGRLMRAYREWFFAKAGTIKPTFVVMEACALFNSAKGGGRTDDKNKARKLLGLANECETNALIYGAQVSETTHNELMTHWVGTCRIHSQDGKLASIARAQAMGWEPAMIDGKPCDDEADALGILNHFAFLHDLPVPWDCSPAPKRENAW